MDKIYDFNQLIVPHFFDVSNAPSIPEKFFALGKKSLYHKDTVIIKYGEKLNCIYYIHSGSILGFRQDNEEKMSLAYIIKNGFFGEGWFFSQRNSRDEVIIGDDSIITMFPKDVVDHLITYPEVVKNLLSGNVTQYEDITMRYATVFGIVTASRIQEFVEAKWDEIDLENNVWIMPIERRKDRKQYPHRVPLPTQLISLLLKLKKTLKGEYIFCPPDKKGHISKESPIRYLRLAADDDVITMHGCRSTFRDWCAENGIDKVLAEKALSHATGNEVEQAYQRSDLLEQRRPVMQKWSDFCFSAVKK